MGAFPPFSSVLFRILTTNSSLFCYNATVTAFELVSIEAP